MVKKGEYKHSQEVKKKISESKKGHKGASSGKHWYNNGVDCSYFFDDEVPNGWIRGRLGSSRSKWINNGVDNKQIGFYDEIPEGYCLGKVNGRASGRDKLWYTDGVNSKYFKEGEQPEGWTKGRTLKEYKRGDRTSEEFRKKLSESRKNGKNSNKTRNEKMIEFCKENDVIQFSTLDKDTQNKINHKFHQYKILVPEFSGSYITKEHLDEVINFDKNEELNNLLIDNKFLMHYIEKYGQYLMYKCIEQYSIPIVAYKNNKLIPNEYESIIDSYCTQFKQHCYSSIEKEFLEYIKSIYKGQVVENYRDKMRGKEIDIYLPELNIGIEFNGVYYHSNKFKNKTYHFDKTQYFNNLGIRVIHIYESEWEYQTEKIKQYLKYTISKTNNVLYARQCKVKELSNKDVKLFSDKNHLQGHRNASVNLGLFYNETLVQIMSFSKTSNAKSNNCEWEIIRECSDSNTIIVGGVSKLFSYFIKKYNPNSVFTYCDYNKFNGKSYELLGMEFVGYTTPDMWWVIGHKLYPRSPQKHKEMKELSGNTCVYGCGSKKYVWEKEKREE